VITSSLQRGSCSFWIIHAQVERTNVSSMSFDGELALLLAPFFPTPSCTHVSATPACHPRPSELVAFVKSKGFNAREEEQQQHVSGQP
jgi:hypothetical protein